MPPLENLLFIKQSICSGKCNKRNSSHSFDNGCPATQQNELETLGSKPNPAAEGLF